jgi:hypothetical protein
VGEVVVYSGRNASPGRPLETQSVPTKRQAKTEKEPKIGIRGNKVTMVVEETVDLILKLGERGSFKSKISIWKGNKPASKKIRPFWNIGDETVCIMGAL